MPLKYYHLIHLAFRCLAKTIAPHIRTSHCTVCTDPYQEYPTMHTSLLTQYALGVCSTSLYTHSCGPLEHMYLKVLRNEGKCSGCSSCREREGHVVLIINDDNKALICMVSLKNLILDAGAESSTLNSYTISTASMLLEHTSKLYYVYITTQPVALSTRRHDHGCAMMQHHSTSRRSILPIVLSYQKINATSRLLSRQITCSSLASCPMYSISHSRSLMKMTLLLHAMSKARCI